MIENQTEERSIELRKKAKEFLKQQPLDPDTQTRISLFLQGLKSINAAILAKVEFQALEWMPYKALHNQYFKEIELSTLLGKSTVWSGNPSIYMDATNLNMAIWQETNASRFLQSQLQVDRTFYEYLSLSHAILSDIRFMPLLPINVSLDTPFMSALNEIEEENGRQIQTQIRMLKDMDIELSRDEKEEIIESQRLIVEQLFMRLLSEICKIS